MTPDGSGQDTFDGIEEGFCDTGILINYLNQQWERDWTTALLEGSEMRFVISEKVEEEIRALLNRRIPAYQDFLGYVLENEGAIEEFSPSGYRSQNDRSHIQELQGELSNQDPREAATRLRLFVRQYQRKADHVFEKLVDEIVVGAAPLGLTFALDKILENKDDCIVISDGADWTNQGGSGLFITLDDDDILSNADEINRVIEEEMGNKGVLLICHPRELVPEGSPLS